MTNEHLRAWAWHTWRAAIITAAITATGTLLLAFIWTTAWALAGEGPWPLPLAVIAVVVLAAGTVRWIRAGKARP
jgi:hypothetical protein